MKKIRLFALATMVLLTLSCNQQNKQNSDGSDSASGKPGSELKADAVPEMNILTAEEESDGWILLFDGKTTDGWKNFNEDIISGWSVDDGSLMAPGLGSDLDGDIVSEGEYGNFILKWEWKLSAHGNSGVMYHVVEGEKYRAPYETGPEYQLVDDEDFWNEDGEHTDLEEWQKTAANYAMYVANDKKQVNPGDWNSSKILFSEESVAYWLNGKKVVEYVPWSEDWNERRNSGKWDQYPDYGLVKKGKICLQDHGAKIWFRNMKIKEL